MLPTYDQDPSFYSDWGDPREYTISDMGEGECAGEVVPYVEVELAAAERELFEAQVLLDEGKRDGASARAFSAMLQAARALTREKNANVGNDAGRGRRRVPQALLRHAAVLRPVRGRQVRAVLVPRPRGAGQGRQPGGGPPADRGGDAVRRRRPPVLHAPRARRWARPDRRRRSPPDERHGRTQAAAEDLPDARDRRAPRPGGPRSRCFTAGSSNTRCPS